MNNQVFEEVKSIAKKHNIVFSDENDIEKCKQEFANKVNWIYISAYQKLSEEFIRKFFDKVNWYYISSTQKLSEGLIREFARKLNWIDMSRCQKLSEEFIKEFSDRVNWKYISKYQKLSESFIREFADKVNWKYISKYQKLSESFIKENKLTILEDNWQYKTKEEKLFYLKENCKDVYEIVDDKYIVAYKSTKVDGHSIFNFQYQYEVNKTYEAHCDCNADNSGSFGLSAWTKEKALEHYCKGKLFKVHINIEDIGAIVHNNKKIRCSKLTIVSEESF